MKKLAIIFVASLLIFAGCKKKMEVMEPTPSPSQVTKMADMKVNADFVWNTEKNIQVDVKSNVKGVLYIKSKDGTIYHKANNFHSHSLVGYFRITVCNHTVCFSNR
ncbi:MAG: hypothetical protein H8E51_08095 [Bacteroidetes bacterium]|nr:hypothetical protein [Bacteroidota bacterium]